MFGRLLNRSLYLFKVSGGDVNDAEALLLVVSLQLNFRDLFYSEPCETFKTVLSLQSLKSCI